MNQIGDLNDDGLVNALDIYILEQYIARYPIAQISPLSEAEFLHRADVNGDGVVNILDVTSLEQLIARAPIGLGVALVGAAVLGIGTLVLVGMTMAKPTKVRK